MTLYCHLYVSFVDWKVNLGVMSEFGAFCKNEKTAESSLCLT
jgi:hypothetical protein